MQVTSYLTFDGTCEEAFKLYERVLGGKIESMFPFEGSPAESEIPAAMRKKIMHARLVVGDQALMGSDAPPGRYEKPQGISISIGVTDVAEAERIWKALSEKGTVLMPLEPTFWAARFGMVTDRFGTPWMVNCEQGQASTG